MNSRTVQINAAALPVGHGIQDYTVQGVLGQGGFGITYLANDNQNRVYAIKEFMPSDFADRDHTKTVLPSSRECQETFDWGLDRFVQEAFILSRFAHKNIVQVERIIFGNNTAYIIMPYEAGKSLSDFLTDTDEGLSENDMVIILLSLLDALAEIHATGTLHRDLKPSNILLRSDGTPVLLDFGSARRVVGAKGLTVLESSGYTPVEQYSTRGNQGPWTDVYSLGAIGYRCIAGVAPPPAMARSAAALEGSPDPLINAEVIGRGKYSCTLLQTIDRALMLREADRFQSAEEWLAALGVYAGVA